MQVPALIDKLSPSWSDVQITHKYKREAMTLNDLMMPIQIEEKHRRKHKPLQVFSNFEMQGKANLVTAKKANNLVISSINTLNPPVKCESTKSKKLVMFAESLGILSNNAKFEKAKEMKNQITRIPFFNKLT